MAPEADRIFLLSPADCSGKRARLLENPEADHDLARRLRTPEGAPLGDVFSFVSSLYFRGKLAYARTFARPPRGVAGVHVITACDGLARPESPLRLPDIGRYAAVPIDPDEARYREPLVRDLGLVTTHWGQAQVILLGSIASGKYTDLLTAAFGDRLLFPEDFVGRGDMSRGGLLLRSAREGRELRYVPLLGAARRGTRPPRLPPVS